MAALSAAEMQQLARLTALETEKVRLETEISEAEVRIAELEQATAQEEARVNGEYGQTVGHTLSDRYYQRREEATALRQRSNRQKARVVELDAEAEGLKQTVAGPQLDPPSLSDL